MIAEEELAEHVKTARNLTLQKRRSEAGKVYQKIIDETSPPRSSLMRLARGEACAYHAREAIETNRLGTAADWYRDAVHADPLFMDYRIELCSKALIPMGALKQAQTEAYRITQIEPDNAQGWRTLASVEQELCNAEECIKAYDKALELEPHSPVAKLDRAVIALNTDDRVTARRLAEEVLDTKLSADAWHTLGLAASRECNFEEAIRCYDMAIDGKCFETPLAHWHKALALQAIGKLREGAIEHEYRGQQTTDPALRLPMTRFSVPLWRGEPAPARIHVHEEGGFGDIIMLARYLSLLSQRGYDVRFETREPIMDLISYSMPDVKVMPRSVDYPGSLNIPMFDYHIPMGSLIYAFGTELDSVPQNIPYIKADPVKVAEYKEKLSPGLKIGLCWSSGIRDFNLWLKEYGRRKSMPYDTMKELAFPGRDRPVHAPSNVFVSLQVGPERREHFGELTDVLPKNPTWSETAALVECLDLVITVDTAVAHLAGAMGKPVWVMAAHHAASIHWMVDRLDSPWYPTAKVYRQLPNRPYYWDDVLRRISDDLGTFIRGA